jgi:nucleotide-binding universal stress UspA family protein
MERDSEKLKLLERWKQTLNSRHTVATFEDGGRLAVRVTADLSRTIHDLEETAKARKNARSAAATPLMTDIASVVTEALSQGVPEASLLSVIRSSVSSLQATLQRRKPKMFLAYERRDQELVTQIADALNKAGVQVWFDTMILPGESWEYIIERALSESDFVAFFLSPRSVTSPQFLHEINLALHRQVSGEGGAGILPVVLAGAVEADVPPLLRQFQWIDLRDGDVDKAVSQLVAATYHWSPKRDP